MSTTGKCFAILPLLAATAAAQLPTVTLTNRAAPRATWVAVTSAGTTTPAGTPPTVPNVNTTFRADSCGAASGDTIWVFGGSLGNNTSTVTNDLWAFNALAGTFTQVQAHGAAGAPPARGRHCAAWNPATGKLVVFGGNTRGATPALLNDTWEYDAASNIWTNVTPVGTSPSPRQFAAMTYDPTLGGMLLFGGQTNDAAPNINSNETWLFLGGAWAQLGPANAPAARGQHSMVTRSDFGDVLLCGGIDNGIATPEQIRFLDVWTWNGVNWTKISDCDVLTNPTGTGATWPGNVNANQAVYDPLRKRVVVQGGQGITVASNAVYVYGPNYGGSPSNYTSEFDCLTNSWSLYSTGTGTTPFNNSDPQIGRISRYFGGFVASTGKVYKICGQNAAGSSSKPTYNVYEYQANPIAAATSYGAGCTSPVGPLNLASNGLPWTGRNWTGTCTTIGPVSLTLAVWGTTATSVPLNPILPVAPVGCNLLNSADALLGPDVPVAGAVTVTLPVPNTPALAGYQLQVQVAELAFDLAFNWIGLYTSNGITLSLGAL